MVISRAADQCSWAVQVSGAVTAGAVQVRDARVLRVAPSGAYQRMTLEAPPVAAAFRPGQFAAAAVGGPQTSMVLRRCFSLYAADPARGTIEYVFAVHGKGTAWLAERRPGDAVDVVGPLGQPFPLPDRPGPQVLVGGGYGSAPLFALADALRQAGSVPHLLVGAASEDRLFLGDDTAARVASVTVTTDDGTRGTRGLVTGALPDLLATTGATTVYACGPMAMLRACSEVADDAGVVAYTAVEEQMACGVGACMTCVLPVVGDDGVTRMVRSCTDGPVFDGRRVRWRDVGRMPADVYGAPAGGGR